MELCAATGSSIGCKFLGCGLRILVCKLGDILDGAKKIPKLLEN